MYPSLNPNTKHWFDLIDRHLTDRGSKPDDYKYNAALCESEYVVRMCQEIASQLGLTINEVLKVERMAAGHVDYHRKFALYCYELSQKDKP